ncbi:Carboxylesterase NlhH [Austwickia sp. TVS 96-490-7B]|uniref:alpha/beta hydrolase n=1 Tax=Austwickia sp. TVS 96-490-7B TaxID=2830843 RepID=UPI001C589D8B|nr:alpha/beta hydrolase [Austwickia sp. TVS 96-490-7B]MBW3086217.1 Carboxylesterase NlhH [Austwickia sp. TVS 96-490-7B]
MSDTPVRSPRTVDRHLRLPRSPGRTYDSTPLPQRQAPSTASSAMSSPSPARTHPPYDDELAERLVNGPVDGHSLHRADIPRLRQISASWRPHPADLTQGGAVWPEERTIPGHGDQPNVPVLILWPTTPFCAPRAALIACHGGGMVTGSAYSGAPGLAGWVAQLGLVGISVEYRLAPEHPYPAALHDVSTVVNWVHDQHHNLGVDPAQTGIFGISAGGGLAAAYTLRAHSEGLPAPAFQIIQDAMLDDRHHRPSTFEHDGSGAWDRTSSWTAWNAYLAGKAGHADTPAYAAPARALDHPDLLRGLPPTYLDVGTADLFRDDVLAYATGLTQAGVATELHLWPGGWHGFSEMAPDTTLSHVANETRTRFLRRMIHR